MTVAEPMLVRACNILGLPMVTLYNQLNREEANTYSLVLNSTGIGNRVVGVDDHFRIDVPERFVDAAMKAIRHYQSENPPVDHDASARQLHTIPRNLSGIAVAILLLCTHLAVMGSDVPEDYITVFGANARRIVHGEVYRCVTALLLHADVAHVAGNMVGLALFGGAVCALTGTGVGWLMILACGISGNLINAMAYETGHISVGASTAVFGAVGILCALQAVAAARTGRGWKRMLMAFGAGVALLAFLGTSARSDLGAHLFGFICGALTGGVYRLGMRHPLGMPGQVVCATIAAGTVLASWMRGVTH